ADPAGRRGAPVWAIGTLRWVASETFDALRTWRGELVDEQGRSWAFLVPTEPWNVAVGDVVRIAGFFYKVWETRRADGSWMTAPLVVGEELLASAFRMDPVTELRQNALDRVDDHDLAAASRPF